MRCDFCCGRVLRKTGKRILRTGVYQMHQCTKCGHQQRGELLEEIQAQVIKQ